MNRAPMSVSIIVETEDCLLCACGRMSLAPMYMRNPAKTPRYNTRKCSGRMKRNVAAAPNTGARASHANNSRALPAVLL